MYLLVFRVNHYIEYEIVIIITLWSSHIESNLYVGLKQFYTVYEYMRFSRVNYPLFCEL
jgi:hypothetical protein